MQKTYKPILILVLFILSSVFVVQAQDSERHCIAEADRLDNQGRVVKLAQSPVLCFDTISEAVYAATSGRVQLPADIQGSELTREIVEQYSLASEVATNGIQTNNTYLLATYWENPYQGGSSISAWASGDCTIFQHWGWSYMPSGWDDHVSSTQSFAACGFNELSEFPSHSTAGIKVDCGYTYCINYIGSIGSYMDDNTSSTYLMPSSL